MDESEVFDAKGKFPGSRSVVGTVDLVSGADRTSALDL